MAQGFFFPAEVDFCLGLREFYSPYLPITGLNKDGFTSGVESEETREINAAFPFVLPTLVDFGEAVFVFISRDSPDLAAVLAAAVIPSMQQSHWIYEFLAKNCEFRVTVTFLILFSTFLDKFIYAFPGVSQMTSGTLPALSPIFMASITVNSNPLVDPMNVSSRGHPPPGSWRPLFR